MVEQVTYFESSKGIETKDLTESSIWVKYTRNVLLNMMSLSPDVVGLIAEYISTIHFEKGGFTFMRNDKTLLYRRYMVELLGGCNFNIAPALYMDGYMISFSHGYFVEWKIAENPKLHTIQNDSAIIEKSGVKYRCFSSCWTEVKA